MHRSISGESTIEVLMFEELWEKFRVSHYERSVRPRPFPISVGGAFALSALAIGWAAERCVRKESAHAIINRVPVKAWDMSCSVFPRSVHELLEKDATSGSEVVRQERASAAQVCGAVGWRHSRASATAGEDARADARTFSRGIRVGSVLQTRTVSPPSAAGAQIFCWFCALVGSHSCLSCIQILILMFILF